MPAVMTTSKASPKWSDAQTLVPVRNEIRKLLEGSQAFGKLSPTERKDLAARLVKVASYLANPEGIVTDDLRPRTPATTLADNPPPPTPADIAARRAASSPGFAGKDFQAGATTQGVQQFGALVQKVDFPRFVSGLIQNVFQAIVDSSIQQMRAYGELLANVAKTVDEFAQDNLTENNARDWLSQKYPGKLDIDISDMGGTFAAGDTTPAPAPKLVTKGDDPESDLKSISTDLGLDKPITDISDPDQEQLLVMQARREMARQRQQLLASMVVLGINRIVVTDGLIHAKVVFDMQASDEAKRVSRASLYDKKEDTSSSSAMIGGWLPIGIGGGAGSSSSSDHITTVQSSLDESSESKAQIKANLTGEVRVNFKSDYFPMEKLASPQMISAIQGNAVPKDKPSAKGNPASAAKA